MDKSISINGSKVENVITRFYYEDSKLNFLILLDIGKKNLALVDHYDNFHQYKRSFDETLLCVSEKKDIRIHQNQNFAKLRVA